MLLLNWRLSQVVLFPVVLVSSQAMIAKGCGLWKRSWPKKPCYNGNWVAATYWSRWIRRKVNSTTEVLSHDFIEQALAEVTLTADDIQISNGKKARTISVRKKLRIVSLPSLPACSENSSLLSSSLGSGNSEACESPPPFDNSSPVLSLFGSQDGSQDGSAIEDDGEEDVQEVCGRCQGEL